MCVTCHISRVTYHVSHIMCNISHENVVKTKFSDEKKKNPLYIVMNLQYISIYIADSAPKNTVDCWVNALVL